MDTSMATRHGRFRAVGYVSPFSPRRHMALLKGDVSGDGDVAVHVHEQRSMTDLVGGPLSPDDAPLHKALRQVQADGRGIVVCLGGRDQLHERTALPSEDEAVVAEILADLGVEQR
jgi:3,4-dihydroxy 2-butanone 4-phosphate synthase/GTP cyclohydrolase II